MSVTSPALSALLQQLNTLQDAARQQVQRFGSEHYQHQYHIDLSPMGWHLGHCVYTENYWIQEAWLQQDSIDDDLKTIYIPELSHKQSRGQRLPNFATLLDWAKECQQQNREIFEQHAQSDDEYMQDQFLVRFLIQHYCQHLETMAMIRQMRLLQQLPSHLEVSEPLPGCYRTAIPTIELPAGNYAIGSAKDAPYFYDNERSQHQTSIAACALMQSPVSNAQYLQFMQQNGYGREEYWSEPGWQWLQRDAVNCPLHWLKQDQSWCEVTDDGMVPLRLDHPVYGINYYEASAYANYKDGRLPHEYEWEAAAALGLLNDSGMVWEWCLNSFHAYPGFVAYPYEGYSVPYFDDRHYVMRGGSQFSDAIIKRPTFRNYYEAEKRHQFAGIRLAFDE